MRKIVLAAVAAIVAAGSPQTASATITYSFTTMQGNKSFTYSTPDFIDSYIDLSSSALQSSSSNFDTAEFCFAGDKCGQTGSSFSFTATTDTIYIITADPNVTVGQIFEFGAGTFGAVAQTTSSARYNVGTLTVDDGTLRSSVPETKTWAMMVGGFGLIGAAMRRRHKDVATHA